MARADTRADSALVEAYVAGDEHAFAELYLRHRDRVFAVALGMLREREAALDVTQDVFCRLVTTLPSFDGRAMFTTWLHRIAINACFDVLRRRKAQPVADPVQACGTGDVVAQPDPDARIDALAALSLLPEDQRAVVVLHDLIGYRYEEIAGMLAIAMGTVKSRLARARSRLAQLLAPDADAFRGGSPDLGADRPGAGTHRSGRNVGEGGDIDG